jgi:hypothetical protein
MTVVVALLAYDEPGGMGLASTHYRIDDGEWQRYGDQLVVPAPADHSGDGAHVLEYYSIDHAGNVEAVKRAEVWIDTRAPQGSFIINDGDATTTETDVRAVSNVVDVHGQVEMRFSIDGRVTWMEWRSYDPEVGLTLPPWDGTKTVYAQYRDQAGNMLELSDEIDLATGEAEDVTPPVTTISGVDDGDWCGTAVDIELNASDESGGSGVAALVVSVDGAEPATIAGGAHQVHIPAPSDGGNDGVHSVTAYAVDVAGNLGQDSVLSFGIDTRPPTTEAPFVIGAPRYSLATLEYRVVDEVPNGGKAAVVIKILDSAGRTVKTLRPGLKSVNKLVRSTFSCELRRGTYRFSVYATDTAGNVQASVGSGKLTILGPFIARRFQPRQLEPREMPFSSGGVIPVDDRGVHDAYGVRMIEVNGVLHDYPGGQARYGLANLNAYRLTGDPFFLERAIAQGERIIARHVQVGAEWYFPNRYTRGRHASTYDIMRSPWYSGMAQGCVLALFGRLYEATGEEAYAKAARGALAGLFAPGPRSAPWTTSIDPGRYLWLQEWPKVPLDYTFNGHMIGSLGLFDYYALVGDRRALALFQGAATTTLAYAPRFRRPGWISRYCLLHGTPNEKYHEVHVGLFLNLYTITGKTAFARFADVYEADYPKPAVEGFVRIAPGTYTGLRLQTNGRLLSRRTVKVASRLRVAVTRRQRIRGGIRLLIKSGPFAGYWLAEVPGRVFYLGQAARLTYSPGRRITLPGGATYTGRAYNDDGSLASTLTRHVAETSTATVSRRAVTNGRWQVLVSSGIWEGYWLPLKRVSLH